MKIILTIILALLFAPSTLAAKHNKVTACSSTLWVPFNWEAKTTIEGAGSTVAKRFFKTQDVTLELVVMGSWARCLKSVETGTIDLAIAAYKTPERASFGHYVEEEIAFDNVRIYINQNKPITFDKLEDLNALQGGGRRGDSYGEQFDNFKKTLSALQWSEVNQPEQNVKKLLLSRLDYILMNPWNMEVILSQLAAEGALPEFTNIVAIGKPITHNGLYFLFSKKSNRYKDFGKEMALFIKVLKTSGKMEKIITDSFDAYKTRLNDNVIN